MCGIGGILITGKGNIDLTLSLKKMLGAQMHRGPDAEGIWVSDDSLVGLCHNRLSIIDLSENANQPMFSNDKRFVVVFNGEIYNYQQLRGKLEREGSCFNSNSDTEVIIEAYRKWGEDMLQQLRGMFSFALYDIKQCSLFCARDRVGKKPFVYAEIDTGFVFASETPAILNVNGVGNDINQNAVASMLLHNIRHIPDPYTVYQGIKRLRAGHAIVVKDGKICREWRYWHPNEFKENISISRLREIIDESVELRMRADVPVGALLSGGIDSTSIVNLMQQYSEKPINTYAFGRDCDDEDIARARIVAKKLATNHKEYFFEPVRQFEVFNKIIKTYGEPIMLLPLIHAYELSEAIRDDGIKVVMNGNGADELFYGYTGHLRTARITKIMKLFGWARYVLPETKNNILSVLLEKPGKRKATMYRRLAEQCWPGIIKTDIIESIVNLASDEMEYWGDILPNKDFIDESNYISLFVENTHSVTIAGDLPAMMASVEMRSPFLDQEIINAAMNIHYSRKVKGPSDGSQLKWVLRKAVHDLVPSEVLNAPKRGFGMGVQEKDIFLNDWRKYTDDIFHDYPSMGLFDSCKIKEMWSNAAKHNNVSWSLVAKLFSIGLWYREVLN
ncbi:MAG: asparagine synthase (glutamine-hydrolyzing) [Gammaproteobacteria bacterium]|nr:asparagine synthase (glutamine-hydrolyzing) [Gammaproteobacteria bacterium]